MTNTSDNSKIESPLSGTLYPDYHVLQQRVYFEDTDFTGIVYHGRYLNFLERGRTDYVRLLGVHHHELDDGLHGERLAFAVLRMELDFKKAARIDEILKIRTERGVLKGPRLIFNQTITRSEDIVLKAAVTVVLINNEGRVRRFPKKMIEDLGVTVT
jgi:acyl-CoA thioester hydrolase